MESCIEYLCIDLYWESKSDFFCVGGSGVLCMVSVPVSVSLQVKGF